MSVPTKGSPPLGSSARPLPLPARAAAHVSRRLRERFQAARDLRYLIGRAGFGLVGAKVGLHTTVGVLPIVFIVGIGLALAELSAGTAPTGATADLRLWLGTALTAFVLHQILAPVQLMLSEVVARRVDTYCSTRLMRAAMHDAPLRTLEREDAALHLHEAHESLDRMRMTPGAAAEGALALIARYAQLVGAVVLLAVVANVWMGLAGLLVALVNRGGHTEAFYRWGRIFRGFAPARKRMTYLRELATSTRTAAEIRTLGLLPWLDKRYRDDAWGYLDPLWSWRRRVYGPPFLLYAVLGLVGTAAVLFTVTASASAGPALEVGALAMALQAIVVCVRFGVMFPESDLKLVYGRGAWESLLAFEELCPAPHRAAGRSAPPPESSTEPPGHEPPRTAIAFEGVGFCYAANKPVLDGLDLQIPVGSATAVVGDNGSGKTTLVKLLTGLYSPNAGRITCDGVDIADQDQRRWRSHFAVTFQDYVRYELSLRENVAIGSVAHIADDAGIRDELARVGLEALVRSLPRGLDTPLSRALPGGRDLSGGQWQRIALARSLFAVRHGASVLVLDEPTAQLDARGEAEFYDTFLELTRGVTSVIIAHRFSSVRRADQIAVIADGRALESGDHEELMSRQGRYARLFTAQAARFTDTVAEGRT